MRDSESVILSIGGERCRIVCKNKPEALAALAHDLGPFVSDGSPTVTFFLEFDGSMRQPLCEGWKEMRMERRDGGFVGEGPSHWVRIPFEMDRVEARIVQYFQLVTVMRFGLCTLLPMRGDGLLVHAAAVGDSQGAYLFPGESGAGKSTLVEHSPGRRRLTEETALIRKAPVGYEVYGFPFWARPDTLSMTPDPMRVRGMFLLKKGRPGINPVTRPQALAYLLRSVYFPLRDFAARRRVLDLCCRFVEEVPSAELAFSKSPDFWRCIEGG